jgi:two-component system chemotaxis response regulator CheY
MIMSAGSLRRKTILVVDDSVHMRTIVSQVLRALPVKRIVEATDGVDAFERLRSEEIDAIVADYRMQPLDGLEFVRMLRTARDSPAPDIPILMMTGHTERSRVLAAKEAGVSGFIAKPISARVLAERLMAAIEAHPFFAPRYRPPPRRAAVDDDDGTYLL